jgi:hypothetical protein
MEPGKFTRVIFIAQPPLPVTWLLPDLQWIVGAERRMHEFLGVGCGPESAVSFMNPAKHLALDADLVALEEFKPPFPSPSDAEQGTEKIRSRLSIHAEKAEKVSVEPDA